MSWNEMIEQFREITKMLVAIENSVLTEGKMDSRIVDQMVEHKHLSPTGLEFLKSLVQHSEKILVLEEDDLVYLVPNPDYEPTEVREIEVWREEGTKPVIEVTAQVKERSVS